LKGADVRGVTQFGMVIGAWVASCTAVAGLGGRQGKMNVLRI